MFKRLKLEFSFVINRIAYVVAGAFLTSGGGILLWVNGTGAVFVRGMLAKAEIGMSFTGMFLVWLLLYGMIGISMSLEWQSSLCGRRAAKLSLGAFLCTMIGYILCLSWYPAFCCARLYLFSAILLTVAASALIAAAVLSWRQLRLTTLILALSACGVLYFAYFSLICA